MLVEVHVNREVNDAGVGTADDDSWPIAPPKRPQTAKPSRQQEEGRPIAIKQLLWDEANTVYELDDPPQTAAASKQKKGAMNKQQSNQQLHQKAVRPNQTRDVYKS